MIGGYPTGHFLSGDENSVHYRWILRNTGHVVFSDANIDSHWSMLDKLGLSESQIAGMGFLNPLSREVVVYDNTSSMSNDQLKQYVEDAFDEKVMHESRKLSGTEPLKWLYSPDYDRFQEWPGEMSHPEVAMNLWGLNADQFANSWGGVHHPDGTIQFGWWPLDVGGDEDNAKRNAPLRLLQHLRKRIDNR